MRPIPTESKSLVIYPHNYRSLRGSGHIEANLLHHGLCLNSVGCDVFGLESRAINEYDFFFVFGKPDKHFINFATNSSKKKIYLIPFDDFENTQKSNLDVELSDLDVTILARGKSEFDFYRNILKHSGQNQDQVLLINTWFLPPVLIDDRFEKSLPKNFTLSMCEKNRDHSLTEYITQRYSQDRPHVNISNAKPNIRQKKIEIIQFDRVKWGNLFWFKALKNCTEFYEPNNRITTSMLEALWLGKKVIIPERSKSVIYDLNTNFQIDQQGNFLTITVGARKHLIEFLAPVVLGELTR